MAGAEWEGKGAECLINDLYTSYEKNTHTTCSGSQRKYIIKTSMSKQKGTKTHSAHTQITPFQH